MNMIIQITTAIAMILSIIVPFGYFFLGEKSKKRYKKSLICHISPPQNHKQFYFLSQYLYFSLPMFC